jgi:multidrug efflux pump
LSQMLTLYTTPVVYLAFDRLRLRIQGKERDVISQEAGPAPSAAS